MSPGIPSQNENLTTKGWMKGKKGRGSLGVSKRKRAERCKEFKGKAEKAPPDTAWLSTGGTSKSPVGIFLLWELAGMSLKTVNKEIGFSCRISTGFSDTELCLSFANKRVSVTDPQSHHQFLLLWWLLMAQIRKAKETPSKFSSCCGKFHGLTEDRLERSSTDQCHSLMQDELSLPPPTNATPACSQKLPLLELPRFSKASRSRSLSKAHQETFLTMNLDLPSRPLMLPLCPEHKKEQLILSSVQPLFVHFKITGIFSFIFPPFSLNTSIPFNVSPQVLFLRCDSLWKSLHLTSFLENSS